jgi:hypothetical protein
VALAAMKVARANVFIVLKFIKIIFVGGGTW